MAETHRFNVNFTEGAYAVLTELAAAKGMTASQVIRDALALEHWFYETRRDGNRVLIETPDGRIREVVPRG